MDTNAPISLGVQFFLPMPLNHLAFQAGVHAHPSQKYVSSVADWLAVHHSHFLFSPDYISQPPLQLGVAMLLSSSQQSVGGSDVYHFQAWLLQTFHT